MPPYRKTPKTYLIAALAATSLIACSGGAGKDPDGPGCHPSSCADLGAECGQIDDGCGGMLECGGCADPETCGGGGANLCGTGVCEPMTCADLGAECGEPSNGCDELLSCGSCSGLDSCGDDYRCGTSVREIATSQYYPFAIAVDGENVYWAENNSTIWRAPTAGGPAEEFATDQDNPLQIALDGDFVYWLNTGFGNPGSIARRSKSGGAIEVLADGQEELLALAIDDTDVYFGEYASGGKVWRIPKSGGTPVSVYQAQDNIGALATAGSRLFVAERNSFGNGVLVAVDKTSLAVSGYAGGIDPSTLVTDGQYVYWGDHDGDYIGRVSTSGANPVVLASGMEPAGLALDNTHIYLTEFWGNDVARVSKAGGAIQTFAEGGSKASGIALDSDSVYWTTRTQYGSVLAAPKP
jgi:hypothetical protein